MEGGGYTTGHEPKYLRINEGQETSSNQYN